VPLQLREPRLRLDNNLVHRSHKAAEVREAVDKAVADNVVEMVRQAPEMRLPAPQQLLKKTIRTLSLQALSEVVEAV
jgi:TPP-dependent pyruvate/acetoin dehydrogenase alpha subunit